MRLNSRPVMDQRWSFFARPVAEGGMLATVGIYSPTDVVQQWDPLNGGATTPDAGQSWTQVYQGPGRVQPNNDWRARLDPVGGQTVTSNAIRFQVPFIGNLLNDGVLPPIEPQWRVRVLAVLEVKGVPVDAEIMLWDYVIRNISASSNSWVQTILCDTIVNDMRVV